MSEDPTVQNTEDQTIVSKPAAEDSQPSTAVDDTVAGNVAPPDRAQRTVAEFVMETMIDCFNRATHADIKPELRLQELHLALRCSKLLPELEMADQKILTQSLKNKAALRKDQRDEMFPF